LQDSEIVKDFSVYRKELFISIPEEAPKEQINMLYNLD